MRSIFPKLLSIFSQFVVFSFSIRPCITHRRARARTRTRARGAINKSEKSGQFFRFFRKFDQFLRTTFMHFEPIFANLTFIISRAGSLSFVAELPQSDLLQIAHTLNY